MLSEHVHGVVRVPVREAFRMVEDAFSHVITYHLHCTYQLAVCVFVYGYGGPGPLEFTYGAGQLDVTTGGWPVRFYKGG